MIVARTLMMNIFERPLCTLPSLATMQHKTRRDETRQDKTEETRKHLCSVLLSVDYAVWRLLLVSTPLVIMQLLVTQLIWCQTALEETKNKDDR